MIRNGSFINNDLYIKWYVSLYCFTEFRFLLETQTRTLLFFMNSNRQSRHVTSVFDQWIGLHMYRWGWSCMAVTKVLAGVFLLISTIILWVSTSKVYYNLISSLPVADSSILNEEHHERDRSRRSRHRTFCKISKHLPCASCILLCCRVS